MERQYPYPSILVNGRNVSLDSIRADRAEAFSAFETNTFGFIRSWLEGARDFVVQTSGSTGQPKPILLRRQQMVASARATAAALKLTEGEHCLLCLGTEHIAGRMMIVRAFVAGMKLICVEPTANPLQNIPARTRIDFIAVVPYQMEQMLRAQSWVLSQSSLRIIIGGAALSSVARAAIETIGAACYATYGMTETLSHIALQKLNGEGKSECFRVLPGVSVELDERGCLVITTEYLLEKVVTNDLAQLLSPDGFLWLGRVDNIINTGGVKVSPEQVEAKLYKAIKGIGIAERFVVSSVPDYRTGEKVVLVVEQDEIGDQLRRRMHELFDVCLSRYERPRSIYCIDSFPLTESGKINRTGIKRVLQESA